MAFNHCRLFRQCYLILFGGVIAWTLSCPAQQPQLSDHPTEADARRFLDEKVKRESDGRISFGMFRGEEGAMAELSGKVLHAVHFRAELSFRDSCMWVFREKGTALSFKTTQLPESGTNIDTGLTNALRIPRRGFACLIYGLVLFDQGTNGWIPNGLALQNNPKQEDIRDFARGDCANNMKQIVGGLYGWAASHDNHFTFNVSTNVGGTKEFCTNAEGGFDPNTAIHLRATTSHMLDPRILVCPADNRQRASGMDSLQATNVTYQMHTGTNVYRSNAKEMLLQCPIHGSVAYCDGSIRQGNK